MKRRVGLHLALYLALTGMAVQAEPESPQPPNSLDAYEAVHEGNRLLTQGEAAKALELYSQAQQQEPDARELAFVQGLGHYALGEYDAARERFQAAVAGRADALADEALYSEGATYHAQALANMQDAEQALGKLEAAMQRYHGVLANQPNHPAARDANMKAATVWQQLKAQLEQQEGEPQPSDQDKEGEKQDGESQDDQKSEEQDQDQQEGQPQDQDQQEPSESSQQDEEPQTDGEQTETNQQERISREQAERRLREMMQAVRQRKKDRRDPGVLVPVRPVEKDW